MTPSLKSRRLALGLSASALAEIMETGTNNIYRIESGTRPPPVRYVRVLELLELTNSQSILNCR